MINFPTHKLKCQHTLTTRRSFKDVERSVKKYFKHYNYHDVKVCDVGCTSKNNLVSVTFELCSEEYVLLLAALPTIETALNRL